MNGNLTSKTDAAGNVTTYTYDKLDRILTSTSKLKDAEGENPVNIVTSNTYTWDGQTASETDARGNTTTYLYDAKGNQVKVTDALGNATLKVYDRMGRNTAIVSPKNFVEGASLEAMERTQYTYDSIGRLQTQTEVYKKMNLNSIY